jgi:hypothetical protein
MSLVDPMIIAQLLAGALVAPKATTTGKSAVVISLYAFAGVLLTMAAVFLLLALHACAVETYTPAQAWGITGGAALLAGLIGILMAVQLSDKRRRESRAGMENTGQSLIAALDSATRGLEEPIAGNPRTSVLMASLVGFLAGNKLHV